MIKQKKPLIPLLYILSQSNFCLLNTSIVHCYLSPLLPIKTKFGNTPSYTHTHTNTQTHTHTKYKSAETKFLGKINNFHSLCLKF